MGRAHEVRKVAMAKTAAKKAKLYSRYGKEIYLIAKAGGPEPDGNLALRRIIEKAKKEQEKADKHNTLTDADVRRILRDEFVSAGGFMKDNDFSLRNNRSL